MLQKKFFFHVKRNNFVSNYNIFDTGKFHNVPSIKQKYSYTIQLSMTNTTIPKGCNIIINYPFMPTQHLHIKFKFIIEWYDIKVTSS